jgi:hypothetical protein
MYSRYQPYPYQRRYYNIDPYYYRRYYNPYYNYQQNIIDSQVADVNQSINNFGDMTDVNQNSNVYQLMTPQPEIPLVEKTSEEVIVCEVMAEKPMVEPPMIEPSMVEEHHMLILP